MSSSQRTCRPGLAVLLFVAFAAGVAVLPAWGRAPVPAGKGKPPRPITNSIGMKLVRVPPGKFFMGSGPAERWREPDEEPLHPVEITRPFHMGVHEVTQTEFEKVMGYNPSAFSPKAKGRKGVHYLPDEPGSRGFHVKGMDTASFPVENMSWKEAVEFCQRLSARPQEKRAGRVYRLPTEAEWEYACREAGANLGRFHFGNSLTSHQANINGIYPIGTPVKGPNLECPAKVGSYKPNALGLYDMHGNIAELCHDWYDPDYYATSPTKDPTGPPTGRGRVARGGSYIHGALSCRTGYRMGSTDPESRHRTIGFRVACVSPEGP